MSAGFLTLLIFVLIHLFANQARVLGWLWHGRFLSFAAGISFAYVFVSLLPALEKAQPILKHAFGDALPYLDRHAYVMALLGVLFYYGIHTQSQVNPVRSYWISLSGYVLFNFFMGVSLSDSNNPDIQPLVFFTIAIGMHYFVRDHNAMLDNQDLYDHRTRWILVIALLVGYGTGYIVQVPETIEALVISFLAGGVFLNSLRYELPKREQVGYLFFLIGSLLYTALLLEVAAV